MSNGLEIPGGIGGALMCIGGLLGLHTGNLLRPSKRVRSEFEKLERKKQANEATPEETGWLSVYKFDKVAFALTWTLIVVGAVVFLIEHFV